MLISHTIRKAMPYVVKTQVKGFFQWPSGAQPWIINFCCFKDVIHSRFLLFSSIYMGWTYWSLVYRRGYISSKGWYEQISYKWIYIISLLKGVYVPSQCQNPLFEEKAVLSFHAYTVLLTILYTNLTGLQCLGQPFLDFGIFSITEWLQNA